MEIRDIIQNENDRLFIIHPECFIVYTGNSLEDEQPFIRIGNYINLPVEIIPLIENIVITDNIIGNPAYEQFNIEIKYLSSNKYIGSKNIVRKYLNFQKLFNLDLKNATIVDIDKDIPDISKEKIISDKYSFIGIFYTNGNFKIVHNNKSIYNLMDMESTFNKSIRIHESISLKNRGSKRYGGNGIVILDNNPLFYKNDNFISYQFPKKYYEDFVALSIDPLKIKDILLPSENFIHLANFLKWVNTSKTALQIFCDARESMELQKRLFSGASISRSDFSGFSHERNGLVMKNYAGTYNLKVTYKLSEPAREDITLAYIKAQSGLNEIIKENLDGIFINYSIYEDTNLLFKSTGTPVAVIHDGNKNISRLRGGRCSIIYPGIQYEFKKYLDASVLFQDISGLLNKKELVTLLQENGTDRIKEIIYGLLEQEDLSGTSDRVELFNIASLLKIFLETTLDRKLSSLASRLISEIKSKFPDERILENNELNIKVVLVFFNNSIYEIIEFAGEKTGEKVIFDEVSEEDLNRINIISDFEIQSFYQRIIRDRKRLKDLLSLYNVKENFKEKIHELEQAINERKKQYYYDEIETQNEEIRLVNRKKRRRKIAKILFSVLVIIAVILLGIVKGNEYYIKYKEQERLEQQKIETEKLIRDYNIHVTDRNILLYANKVAVKNGYSRITLKKLKGKNPHWIYPGNVFTMLDGEQVEVKEGDTLWDMSHKKIMQIHISFYKLINKIKETKKKGVDIKELLKEAEDLVFTEEHTQMVETLKKEMK